MKRTDINPKQVLQELKWIAKYEPETGKFICIATSKGRTVSIGNEWPPNYIDHINKDRTDNRWDNLRSVTAQQNQLNRKHSGGVGWHKASGKWRAYLTINCKQKHLGLFSTKEKAQAIHFKAYKSHKESVGA